MRATRVVVFYLAVTLLCGAFFPTTSSGANRNTDSDPKATISALQTEVSRLKTQVATLVPTATATAMPLATVPTEPRVLADGLELVYYYAVEDGSRVALLGEIRNTTDQRYDSPYLRIVFLDRDANIVDTTDASPTLVTIGPGESVPFEADIYDLPRDEWHHEEIRVCDWPSDDEVLDGYGELSTLKLQDIEETEKSADWLQVRGKVRNDGTTPLKGVSVKALVYLPDGRYAGDVETRLDVAVPPGKTARFTLSGGGYELPGLKLLRSGEEYTYRLWVGIDPFVRVYVC